MAAGCASDANAVSAASRRAPSPLCPTRSSSVDVVVSFDVLYCLHPPEEKAAVAEMHRVLRSGGWLIVNVAALKMLTGDHSILVSEKSTDTRREELRASSGPPASR